MDKELLKSELDKLTKEEIIEYITSYFYGNMYKEKDENFRKWMFFTINTTEKI